ncbi:MAG: type IV pilin protein [Oligoflexales bacterium]
MRTSLVVNSRNQAGFSLVELMIVVAIIGLLATIAVPRFEIFRAKARQVEAKNNLSHVYTLQHSFFGDNEEFATMPTTGTVDGSCSNVTNDLGFYLSPCNGTETTIRYAYASTGNGNTGFTATATSGSGGNNRVVAGCDTADVWEINQDKALENTSKAVVECND